MPTRRPVAGIVLLPEPISSALICLWNYDLLISSVPICLRIPDGLHPTATPNRQASCQYAYETNRSLASYCCLNPLLALYCYRMNRQASCRYAYETTRRWYRTTTVRTCSRSSLHLIPNGPKPPEPVAGIVLLPPKPSASDT